MTSLINRMAQASARTRARYALLPMGGQRHVVVCDCEQVFEGIRPDCLSHIDRQCIRAAVEEMVPSSLVLLAEKAAEGVWEALPFSYDRGVLGPDWFLAGGEPIQGNLGGDFDEADAKFAAACVNAVRAAIDAMLSEARQ